MLAGHRADIPNGLFRNIELPVTAPYGAATPRPPFKDAVLPLTTPPSGRMMRSAPFSDEMQSRTLVARKPKLPLSVAVLATTKRRGSGQFRPRFQSDASRIVGLRNTQYWRIFE